MSSRNSINSSVPKISSSELTDRKIIGQGSFGCVYVATHKAWGIVAYKQLVGKREFVEDSLLRDLEKEVNAQSQLRHPNIVQMLGMVRESMVECGIVLWYERYGDLRKFMRDFRVPPMWRLQMIYHVTLGMNYLHTQSPRPILHGDLKIINILVGEGFVAKIGDFGLAVWRDYSTQRTNKLSSSVRGTVTHVAPERLKNVNLKLNEKADIYSLGILVWEILSGRRPYQGCPEDQIRPAVKEGQRPSLDPDVFPSDAPEEVVDIMKKAWSHDPSLRPSCQDIMFTLERLKDRWKNVILEAESELHKQASRIRHSTDEGNSSDYASEPQSASSDIAYPVTEKMCSDAPGVNHAIADKSTDLGKTVPCDPSWEINAQQPAESTGSQGRSGGYEFRKGNDYPPFHGMRSDHLQDLSPVSGASGSRGRPGQFDSHTVPYRIKSTGKEHTSLQQQNAGWQYLREETVASMPTDLTASSVSTSSSLPKQVSSAVSSTYSINTVDLGCEEDRYEGRGNAGPAAAAAAAAGPPCRSMASIDSYRPRVADECLQKYNESRQ